MQTGCSLVKMIFTKNSYSSLSSKTAEKLTFPSYGYLYTDGSMDSSNLREASLLKKQRNKG